MLNQSSLHLEGKTAGVGGIESRALILINGWKPLCAKMMYLPSNKLILCYSG